MSDHELNINLHPKQSKAFLTEANEVLYGGSAGSGKSYLMRAASIIWCTKIPGLQVYLFRRLSDDLAKNHLAGPGGYHAILAKWTAAGYVKFNASKSTFTFFNGAQIYLCHCQYSHNVQSFQGAEIHVLMIDELTHWDEEMYRFLRGRCRLGTLELPEDEVGNFPRVLCGTNPGSIGHAWVRRTWVDSAPYGSIHVTSEEEGGMRRQYIPALLTDNPSQDKNYASLLKGLGSEDLVRALLEGRWDIVSGGGLDDLWRRDIHVIPRTPIPYTWKLNRAHDWGSSEPFAVGWFAESNGEEMLMGDGTLWAPVAGSLIMFGEWYGTVGIGTNKGIKMGPRDVARGILEMEIGLRAGGWIKDKVQPGPADNQIRNVQDRETETIEKRMAAEGVKWTSSDKSPGSRVQGLLLLRDRLQASLDGEGPGIYFMNNCLGTIATLPVLPRDKKKPNDIDTKAEDHLYDMLRYEILDGSKTPIKSLNVRMPT